MGAWTFEGSPYRCTRGRGRSVVHMLSQKEDSTILTDLYAPERVAQQATDHCQNAEYSARYKAFRW